MSVSVESPAAPATVALVGNPNTGKSTLFNALTGMSVRVGNYPGVTVEKVAGRMQVGDRAVELVDLPGCYSMSAHSPDEGVVVDVLIENTPGFPRPHAVLAVLDASNIERNLYLLSQVMEAGYPIIAALNMVDVAAARGIRIDSRLLSQRLGVPVVEIEAHRGRGLDRLKEELGGLLAAPGNRNLAQDTVELPLPFYRALERVYLELREREPILGRKVGRAEVLRALVDQDGHTEKRLAENLGPGIRMHLARVREDVNGEIPLSALEAQARYAWVRRVLAGAVTRPERPPVTWTDRIDRVVTHPILGGVFLLALLAVTFQSIYAWSGPLQDGLAGAFGALGSGVGAVLPPGALRSLVVDGLIAGVGAVLGFLPQILILFLFIALLEDCGYMSRAAFLLDRVMARCGLSGKSFIPLLSSFACAVPGIMATRVVEDRRDRLATILVAPLMTCSARLPVYTVLIGAFVPPVVYLRGWVGLQGTVLLGLYLLGIVSAVVVAWVLKRTILRGDPPAFVMELPSYKWPVPKVVVRRLYLQGKEFVVRAGTIILTVTVVVWALGYFPRSASVHEEFEARRAQVRERAAPDQDAESAAELADLDSREAGEYLRQSYLGRMGRALEPVFRPLGWDWRIGMASIASFPAREVVVATLGTIFNLGQDTDETNLGGALKSARWEDGRLLFSLPVALGIMVFFALCCQCGATVSVIRKEAGSWGWAAFAFTYMTVLAYIGAMLTYRIGSAL